MVESLGYIRIITYVSSPSKEATKRKAKLTQASSRGWRLDTGKILLKRS